MKIIAASDLHGVKDVRTIPVEGVDICIFAGDIAPLTSLGVNGYIEQLKWVENVFIPFMEANPKTEFVFVAGNHDFWGIHHTKSWPKNAHYLLNSGCEIKGVKFYGMPFVPVINGLWVFESSSAQLQAACEAIPDGINILIAHTPPRVAGSDIDSSTGVFIINGKEPHFGSPELTEAVERVQPDFLFCGHIHTGDHGCVEIGKTKCFNVSILNEDYSEAYGLFEDEIEL